MEFIELLAVDMGDDSVGSEAVAIAEVARLRLAVRYACTSLGWSQVVGSGDMGRKCGSCSLFRAATS